MKMNRNFGGVVLAVLAALLLLPAASAASVSDDAVITPEGEIRAGITPDSPLHFFERSIDRMRLAFTADPERKAEKAMEIARERLMEAKKMAEKGDAKAAGKAQRLHEQMLARVEDSARKISDDSSRTRLEVEIEIENELDEHRMEIETVESRVKSRISLSDSNSVEAVNLLSRFRTETERVRAEVEKEKEKSITMLKLETGQSDDEIRQIVRSIEDRVSGSGGRGRDGRGEIELSEDDRTRVQARAFDDFTRIKVEIDFSTLSEDRNAILGEMLSKFRLSREEIDRLLDLRVAEDTEEPRERLRTEAKVRDDRTEAELELEFPVNTKDREAIINAIFNKLNSLSIGDLDAAMRIEDRRGLDDDENELLDRRRGADKPEDDGVNDVSGREAEARGREAEGEAPRGADSPSDFDSTPGSRGGGSSGGSGSGSGGSSSDD